MGRFKVFLEKLHALIFPDGQCQCSFEDEHGRCPIRGTTREFQQVKGVDLILCREHDKFAPGDQLIKFDFSLSFFRERVAEEERGEEEARERLAAQKRFRELREAEIRVTQERAHKMAETVLSLIKNRQSALGEKMGEIRRPERNGDGFPSIVTEVNNFMSSLAGREELTLSELEDGPHICSILGCHAEFSTENGFVLQTRPREGHGHNTVRRFLLCTTHNRRLWGEAHAKDLDTADFCTFSIEKTLQYLRNRLERMTMAKPSIESSSSDFCPLQLLNGITRRSARWNASERKARHEKNVAEKAEENRTRAKFGGAGKRG